MGTQLKGPPCPQRLLVQTDPDQPLTRVLILCQQGEGHPLDIHTGEHRLADGSRLVVTWGEG